MEVPNRNYYRPTNIYKRAVAVFTEFSKIKLPKIKIQQFIKYKEH